MPGNGRGNQPVIQLRNLECPGGARIATQWYWPPDVGALVTMSEHPTGYRRTIVTYMETNSASEAAVAKDPSQQKMKPYTKVGGPPFNSAVLLEL